MSFDQIAVTVAGLGLIGFIAWFFSGKKEQVVAVEGSVEINVDGGYSPEVISVRKGKPTTLTFIRKDPSPCLEEVIISDFGIRKHLPLNEKVSVEVTPTKEGSYIYSCGMNMYRGKIVVS